MGRIIKLRGGDHHEVQTLLPWYVTGRLDADEQTQIEAHLAGCPQCQAELRFQRRLNAEIAGLPVDVEQGWLRMRQQIEMEARTNARGGWASALSRRLGPATPWLGWATAAVVAIAAGVVLRPAPAVDHGATYHALGSAPKDAAGNVIVIFRPDTRESDLRGDLNAGHARLVDGPTAAGAYVLHVPAAQRSAILLAMRARPDIVLAEPVDAGAAP